MERSIAKFRHNDKMKDDSILTDKLKKCIRKQIMEGEPFEIIDGDNLVFCSKDLVTLLGSYYDLQNNSDKGNKEPKEIKIKTFRFSLMINASL